MKHDISVITTRKEIISLIVSSMELIFISLQNREKKYHFFCNFLIRPSKGRHSLAQTTQAMTEVLSSMKTYDIKSNNDHHRSIVNELQAEHNDKSDTTAARLMQRLTVISHYFFPSSKNCL